SMIAVPLLVGQMPQLKRPEDKPEEKLPEAPKKKKIKGPRAVGILQIPKSGKPTLIPVAILVEGKFYDAGSYKADPVPMALEAGTVYEAEKEGDSDGLFTISGALHSKNPNALSAWVGAGTYLPPGTKVEADTHKAEDVPVGMNGTAGDDGPPKLTRGKKTDSSDKAGNASTSATQESQPGNAQKSSTPTAPSGSPPASDKGTGAGSTSAPDGSGTKSGSSNGPAEGAKQGGGTDAPVAPAASQTARPDPQKSGSRDADNFYRPTLRHGKPTQAAPPDEEEPVAAGATKVAVGTVPAKIDKSQVQMIAAVSDAGGPDPRSYQFYWKEGEQEERRKQMLALAADEVRIYLNARAAAMISAKPPAPKSAPTKAAVPAHKTSAKSVQPEFENVEFRGFDVWANNQPVMVLTADAHVPQPVGSAGTVDSYSVTLVARTDIYGELRKLYSGVTDKFHLDVTPRLELIDAVDADGDGRGELLFRETSDSGSGYLIYRATADKLWKLFDSANAQQGR
ncbi:MAG TPA: hypothetical protein VND65_01990, partial [Candidatus Binatia bacterium]|nr:hypothetical protein [Candidatus Binatia bacterium]